MVTRLQQLLLGKIFTLKTDRKRLRYNFCPNIQLPRVISVRLASWTITLMAHDYDVHYVPGEQIGHADAMSRRRFKNDQNDLVATVSATFEIPVIDINFLQKQMASDHSNKRIFEKNQTGKWNNCGKMEKEYAKEANALIFQIDLTYNGWRVYIRVAYRKQVIEKLHDVHQGVNALKVIVKNVA